VLVPEPDEPDDPDDPDEPEDPLEPDEPLDGGVGAGVAGGGVTRGVDGVLVGAGGGVDEVPDGTGTFGSLVVPVPVVAPGVVGVVVVGVVATGGVVAAGGGAWATWFCAAVCVGGIVWSSLRAAYDAATAPASSSPVRPRTADIERTPGRPARRPAAVPHARHQSWPGSIVAPQDLHVRSSGSGGACSGGASTGGSGGASRTASGCRSSSFIGPQGCTTRRNGWE
jgi:hypothetical protein